MTRLSLSRLRSDRMRRKGIPYVKLGRSVRYSLADVIRHLESRKVETD